MPELNSLTVVQLKQLLKEQGLTISGKKSELISRLESHDEVFLSLEEDSNSNQTKVEPSEKIVINCPLCGRKITYPSNHLGRISCPSCNRFFKPSTSIVSDGPKFGKFLLLSSLVVFVLTIVIALIVGYNDTSSQDGQLGSGMAAGFVFMGGMMISGTLFALSLVFTLVKNLL